MRRWRIDFNPSADADSYSEIWILAKTVVAPENQNSVLIADGAVIEFPFGVVSVIPGDMFVGVSQ